MDLLRNCAQRIINDGFATASVGGLVICDRPHAELAKAIGEVYRAVGGNGELLILDGTETSEKAFKRCRFKGSDTIVLLEPKTFSELEIYKWLDFSYGEPKVAGVRRSYVSIMPLASTLRVYGSPIYRDTAAKAELLSILEADANYIIRNASGTELFFTARRWLNQNHEILTAPLEASVSGTIAVDGAFFFRKIDRPVDFFIKAGELVDIKARDKQGDTLVDQYRQMTRKDFSRRANRQLAEIGLGFNTGALISDCFMESETVYGTCHFCFGNNVCYGGNNESDFHGGSVLIKKPRFILRDSQRR